MDIFNDISEVSKNFMDAINDVKNSASNGKDEGVNEPQCSCDQNDECGCENKCFNNGPEIDFKKFGEVLGGIIKPIKEVVSPVLDEVLPDQEEIDKYVEAATELVGNIFNAIAKGFDEVINLAGGEDVFDSESKEAKSEDEPEPEVHKDDADEDEDFQHVHVEIPFDNGEPTEPVIKQDKNFKTDDQPISKEYFNFPSSDEKLSMEIKPTSNLKELLDDAVKSVAKRRGPMTFTLTPVEEEEPVVAEITYEEAYDDIVQCFKDKNYELTRDERTNQPIIKVEYQFPEDMTLEEREDEAFSSYCLGRLRREEGFTYVEVQTNTVCSDDSDCIHVTVKVGL